jgi:hypothetical protein
MNTSDAIGASNPEAVRIVQGLFALRDSPVEMALLLRDFQFESDMTDREEAVSQTLQVVERAKSRAY